MKIRTELGWQRRHWLLAALAAVGGCGGVDSGGTGTGSAPPTLAVGAITGFGSIIVNGVRYDDTAAAIENDDAQAITRDQLKLGMQAVVQASAITSSAGVSSATASSVAVRSELTGPIEAIDRAQGRITALGQRVAVVPATVFDAALPMGLAALNVGDVIEVHGAFDAAAAQIVASRIDRRGAVAAYKLRGTIGTLALGSRTFTIGAAVVDWSGVPPADPATALAPGSAVRVTLVTTPSSGTWRATSLSTARPQLADRDRVEIEGRISAFTSLARFEVNGFVVDASAAAFPDGTTGIVLGAKVEVEGSARGGVLVAQTVKREDDAGGFELNGTIESADPVAQRFVVRGVTVSWNASTRFDSSTPADLQNGRRVEVRGVLSADGTRLEAALIHIER
jgi:Domain of unknown function (DUF5666)